MSSHGHGAAARALDLLEAAVERAKKNKKGAAGEDGLHRFRVSVRRLRVHLKAHVKACRTPRKLRRRLREAFRRTNEPRDAQVALSWINGFAARTRRRGTDAGALAAKAAMLRPRDLRPEFWREFVELSKDIRRSLKKRRRASADRRGFREDGEIAAQRAFRLLAHRISRLDLRENSRALHKVRVAAKRLRYILESCKGEVAGVPALEAVRKFQRLLGGIHDLAVVEDKLEILRHENIFLDAQATAAIGEVLLRRARLLFRARREWSRLGGLG